MRISIQHVIALAVLLFLMVMASAYFFIGVAGSSLTNTNSSTPPFNRSTPKYPSYLYLASFDPREHLVEPPLFYCKEYPPTTPAVDAMWCWYHSMDVVHPLWQWDRPIKFYGLVLDETESPITSAEAHFTWTGPQDSEERTVESGGDGRFELTATGKNLTVAVMKRGYEIGDIHRIRTFEYADFFDSNFAQPDREKPVVFHLWNAAKAEPIKKFAGRCRFLKDTGLMISVGTGATGSAGDVEVGVHVRPETKTDPYFFDLAIFAQGAAGVVETPYPRPRQAPETGWASQISYAEDNRRMGGRIGFYVRTADQKYAAVFLELESNSDGTVTCDYLIFYNPSGSRNLIWNSVKDLY